MPLSCPCLPLVPTPEEMRQWDAHSAALGLPPAVLMENAARAALAVLREHMGELRGKRVLCYMGSGNNGGDAACLARHARDLGAEVLVAHVPPLSRVRDAARLHVRVAQACGVPFTRVRRGDLARSLPGPGWHTPDIIVDGLLGTGFRGVLRPDMQALITAVNAQASASRAFVLALDTPSGCDALTGLPCPCCLTATATACLGAAKPGLVLPHARQYTGTLHICDIGMPRAVRHASLCLLGRHCAPLLPTLPDATHKGTFGHVLALGGSHAAAPDTPAPGGPHGMYGAPQLSALAALRTGAGLASLAVPTPPPGLLAPQPPAEVMTLNLPATTPGQWDATLVPLLRPLLARIGAHMGACAVGMGMGRGPGAAAFVEALLRLPGRPPVVLDADALNLAACNRAILALLTERDVATPHPAEAARLLESATHGARAVQADRPGALERLKALAPCVWVLKGAGTLVGQRGAMSGILPHDIPALAIAGSGDVLSGCAAALLGQGMPALAAAMLAVSIHAHAGLLLQARHPRGGLAGELCALLPHARETLADMPEPLCWN